jgi:hypothetical protein
MKIFQEDDCLNRGQDPDYLGIYGWWEERFNEKFAPRWADAKSTEVDEGDCFTRTINTPEGVLLVTLSYDGFFVVKPDEGVIK